MRCEAVLIAGGIAILEDLRCCHVTGGPSHKGHGQGGRFLGLASDVAGNEGKDEVSFREVELGAVEGDQETDSCFAGRRNRVDNCGSYDRGAV